MEEQNEVIDPDEMEGQIITDESAEPLSYADVRLQLGLAGQPVPTKNLVDHTFDIYRAKRFPSSFEQADDPYFCVVKPVDSAEKLSVVLGGGACVEVLDAVSASGIDRPIRVTLRFKEAGKFSGYYYFE